MRTHSPLRAYRVFIAAAALALSPLGMAGDQFNGNTTDGNLSAWRINKSNAELSLCSFEGMKSAPNCYPASAKAAAGNYDVLDGNDLMSRWRINLDTGAMSLCEYKDTSAPPMCSPWSE